MEDKKQQIIITIDPQISSDRAEALEDELKVFLLMQHIEGEFYDSITNNDISVCGSDLLSFRRKASGGTMDPCPYGKECNIGSAKCYKCDSFGGRVTDVKILCDHAPRVCTECGSQMWHGYFLRSDVTKEGKQDEYYCSDKCLNVNYTPEEWAILYKHSVEVDTDECYWTEWEKDGK